MKFYTNIERREIHLPPELTMEYVPFFITSINDMISDMDDDKDNIVLYCSSYGGDLYSALAIMDCITGMDIKVNTLCFGACMSASALILASGTGKRVMSKNSTVMVHSAVFDEGKTSYVVKSSEHLRDLKINVTKLLSDVTNKEEDFWKRSLKNDLYLNSNQCLEYGIVDRIV